MAKRQTHVIAILAAAAAALSGPALAQRSTPAYDLTDVPYLAGDQGTPVQYQVPDTQYYPAPGTPVFPTQQVYPDQVYPQQLYPQVIDPPQTYYFPPQNGTPLYISPQGGPPTPYQPQDNRAWQAQQQLLQQQAVAAQQQEIARQRAAQQQAQDAQRQQSAQQQIIRQQQEQQAQQQRQTNQQQPASGQPCFNGHPLTGGPARLNPGQC